MLLGPGPSQHSNSCTLLHGMHCAVIVCDAFLAFGLQAHDAAGLQALSGGEGKASCSLGLQPPDIS